MKVSVLPRFARLLGALGVAASLTGCATAVITPEQETSAGVAMQHQVAEQIGLYVAPELDRYLDSVGQRLVAALGETPYSFQFAIVDQFEPNAFASPGGFIYISRGLGAGLLTLPGRAVGVVSEDLGNMMNTPINYPGKVYLSYQVSFTPIPPLATTTQLYGHLDGMWWGPQNPQQGIFDGGVFRSADLDFSVTFPQGWETMNTPRFVGAAEPEQGAYLALGSNEGEFTPEGYGAALITRMRDRAGLEPAVSRSFKIGDWPAHVVRCDDSSGGIRLRTAQLRNGESLDDWSKRLGSQWGPVFSAAMNGLPAQGHSGSGELLKYARKEQYHAQ